MPVGNYSSNRLVRGALGNWQLSGTTQAQTGEPFTVSQGNDYAGVGPGAGNQPWVIASKPQVYKKFSGSTGQQWFEGSVYHEPAGGTFAGRGTRNAVYMPGFQSWNAALQKTVHVTSGHDNHSVVFKVEAFNFVDHPNLDTPDTNPTSAIFGQVTQKGNTYASDRQFQFSLRFAF